MWWALPFAWAVDPPPIFDRPLPFDAERAALSVAYLREHYGLVVDTPTIVPTAVVIHWTAGPSFESLFTTFAPTRLRGRPELSAASPLNVSSQFAVDRDGTIYRLLPETTMARHTIGMNWDAIGVENVGGGRHGPLTEAQARADAALVRWLTTRFPITMLLGHDEYLKLEGTPYFRERQPDYRTKKEDPGPEFMKRLRSELADLKLAAP
jgi:N-acetylmuramoyl-L-alanine amidase